MGVRELAAAFNEIASPDAKCVKAFMEYKPSGGYEYQMLYFSGSYADGTPFVIESEPIRASGDLVLASRATAQALLDRKRTPAT